MNLLRFFRPLIIGILILLVILGVLLICMRIETSRLLVLGPSREYTPEDGVWYCSELEMQLSFSKKYHSTVVMGEEKLQCSWINDKGSDDIYVVCQEIDNQFYDLGELLFWLEYVSMDEETYEVKNHDTGETYVFIKLY